MADPAAARVRSAEWEANGLFSRDGGRMPSGHIGAVSADSAASDLAGGVAAP